MGKRETQHIFEGYMSVSYKRRTYADAAGQVSTVESGESSLRATFPLTLMILSSKPLGEELEAGEVR
jgi:hypothetical protein